MEFQLLHSFRKAFDKIFGGNAVDIRPQGSAELIFGLKINRLDNPQLPEEQRQTTSFDFQEKIQMNVIGKIGDKLKLTTNFNTESTFDFENQMKLEYNGYEDEIIKKLEVGNVSLPLNGTLITGSQSLFGFKTQMQFGRTTITGILSQQKSTTSEVSIHTNLLRDLYIVLGEGNINEGWAVRIYNNPLVIWIWIGVFIIFSGGLLALKNSLNFLRSNN